jgi:hypothetical protein
MHRSRDLTVTTSVSERSAASRWVKSSYCVDSDCVEVAITSGGVVLRNSVRPDARLFLSSPAFTALLALATATHARTGAAPSS